MNTTDINDLTHRVIGCCMQIHKEIGPGLLESAYEECLAYELNSHGIRYKRQVELPLTYKDLKLDVAYRLDFLVEEAVIPELKAVSEILPVHEAQILTYLKLAQKELGLLINFNVPTLKQGIKRIILDKR